MTLSDLLTGAPPIDTPGDVGPGEFGPPKSRSGREPLPLAELLTNPEALNAAFQSGQLNLKDFLGGQQETGFTREARLAGKPPGSPEFAEAFEAKNRQDPSSQLALELLAEIRNEDVVKRQTERLAGIEEKRISRAEGRIAIRNTFSLATEAVQLERDLQRTFLQSGLPGGEELRSGAAIFGALQEFFGKDSPQALILGRKRDRLKKLYADLLGKSIANLKSARGITDQRQRTIIARLPTLENTAVPNVQLLGDMMRDVLDGADIAGYKDIENREAIRAFIDDPIAGLTQEEEGGPSFLDAATGKARSAFGAATEQAQSGIDAATAFATEQIEQRGPGLDLAAKLAAIKLRKGADATKDFINALATATIEDIKSINREDIADWTAKQRDALDKRLKELGF